MTSEGAVEVGLNSLSVVVPAYNEVTRLEATLRAILKADATRGAEIVVVDDGSTDATVEIAHSVLDDRPLSRVITLPRNEGKGAAVRAGVLATTGSAVVYMDADLATDLDALAPALASLRTADVVVGSRVGDGAEVENSTRSRAVMARVFNGLVKISTDLEFRDTQCGFKMFRGDVARELFDLSRSRGFAFDVEVLVLARRLGYRIVELPVRWTAVEGSSIRPIRDSLQMAFDLARIAARWTPRRAERAAAMVGVVPPACQPAGPIQSVSRSASK